MMKTYRWVLSTYLMQGIPYALVTLVSPVLYKSMGLSNSKIALYTSLFIFPWIFKFFFAPALENLASKRKLILYTQFAIAGLTSLLALNLYMGNLFSLSNFIFFLIACASAIHDINADGLYLEALDHHAQARFIGIRSLFYQLGRLLCQGGLILAVGLLETSLGQQSAWVILSFLLAFIIFCVALFNEKVLPPSVETYKPGFSIVWKNIFSSYREVFLAVKKIPHLLGIVILLFFYNFPDAQLGKIIPLFMLDSKEQGGLGLGVEAVGLIYGSLGIGSMLLGITLSGFLLARFSLKKCLFPFTFFMACSNTSYLLLSYTSPSLSLICFSILIVQFSFGLGNGAYMLYLINRFAKGDYSMSLYAIGTAIMLLSVMVAGATSGYMQTFLGYQHFFLWIVLLSILVIGLAFYNARKIL